jgi:hypothetical protein
MCGEELGRRRRETSQPRSHGQATAVGRPLNLEHLRLVKLERGILSTYRKVNNDANFQPTKAHLNSLLFIFPPARALENVSTFLRKCCNIF